MDDLTFLGTVGLFRDIPHAELEQLMAMATTDRFYADDVILLEGEATNDLIIVREGNVEVYVSRDSKRIPITTLSAGSYFGEMSAFDDYPRSANVRAVTDVVVLRIDRDAFRTFLKSHPGAMFQMCMVFSHRLRNTNSALAKH
jgi:CRP/FNR family cyclic AMP-dependent transcriptional regulator